MKRTDIWNFIQKIINSGKEVVLLTVAESSNSSPGRQGFKMAVSEDAEVFGTIGGGIMEKDMIEYSLDLLFGNESKTIKRLHHTDKTKHEKSGLICGGYQIIIFSIIDNLLTGLTKRIISSGNEKKNGELVISPAGIEYNRIDTINPVSFNYKSDDDWEYRENIGLPLIAFIAGGGHVGLAVSRIMKLLFAHPSLEIQFYC